MKQDPTSYPTNETQKATSERHATRRNGKPMTTQDLWAISQAEAKRERKAKRAKEAGR